MNTHSTPSTRKINLFIVRHGHADFGTGLDFERQLKDKGIKAVEKTAIYIQNKCRELSITLNLCISSAAVRTQQTAQILCQTNHLSNCKYYQELYSTVTSQWLEKLSEESAENIVIVGHNPTFSQMVNHLCGYEIQMKPAHCAFITLEICDDGIIYPATLNDYYQHE